jgi:hypothetical protein
MKHFSLLLAAFFVMILWRVQAQQLPELKLQDFIEGLINHWALRMPATTVIYC